MKSKRKPLTEAQKERRRERAAEKRERLAAMQKSASAAKLSIRENPLEMVGDDLYWNKQLCGRLLPQVSGGLIASDKCEMQQYINDLENYVEDTDDE